MFFTIGVFRPSVQEWTVHMRIVECSQAQAPMTRQTFFSFYNHHVFGLPEIRE